MFLFYLKCIIFKFKFAESSKDYDIEIKQDIFVCVVCNFNALSQILVWTGGL